MFSTFLLGVRKQTDYLRGEDNHVGQEKELQFDMQLTGGTVSYFKNVWRERGFPPHVEEAALENRHINFILSNLLEKKSSTLFERVED